jgi:2-oxoglutarate ferredoxin oxidoreductase subunit alpha
VVIVNIMRGGPGLGGILPSQSDYFQATKGGGHGDYRCLVLAPASVQEAADLMIDAFDLADKYRNPVLVLGDGLIGQMMEPVEFKKEVSPEELPLKPWATTGCKGRKPNIINSLYLAGEELEQHNWHLQKKYAAMREDVRHEAYNLDGGCDALIVAYGTVARIAKTAIETLNEHGLKVGLFRPITLYPFPGEALKAAAETSRSGVLVSELSCGQMLEDVQFHVRDGKPIAFYGRVGGMVMSPDELVGEVVKMVKK